jgi:uncharacterized repeat protein (TIGR04138 family)
MPGLTRYISIARICADLMGVEDPGHEPLTPRPPGSCGVAGGGRLCYLFVHATMQDLDFAEIIELICKEDARYDKKAYFFVRHGLDQTVNNLKKNDPTRAQRSPHVSGRELLEGLRAHALDQFGPLAKTVLESWGVRRCTDFGNIVFNLIEYNIFSKTDNDRREDFADIYDFDEAFVKPFQPAGKRRAGPSAEPVSSV